MRRYSELAQPRPAIIVLSSDTDDTFRWLSDGWYSERGRGTAEAKDLMRRARSAIEAGIDVPNTIERLVAAGFMVRRTGPA